jgi:chromosome segregation ATPase
LRHERDSAGESIYMRRKPRKFNASFFPTLGVSTLIVSMNTNSSPSLGRPLVMWMLVVFLLFCVGGAMSMNGEQKLKIAHLLNRVTTLKGDKERLKEHRAELIGKNAELQRSKVALTVDLGETVKRLEAKSAELDGEKAKTGELTGKLAEVETALAGARNDNESLGAQIVTLQRERESLKKDIANLYTVATNTKAQVVLIERERESLKKDIASLHAAAEGQKAKIGELEGVKAGLQRQLTDAASEQGQHISMLQSSIESMNKTLASMREETQGLSKVREQLSAETLGLKKQVDTLTAQAQTMQATIAERDKTITTLDTERKELMGLRDKLAAEVQELTRKVADLMQTSQQQQNSLNALNEDKIVLQNANVGLVSELDEMTKRLTELSLANESQAMKIIQLTDEREALSLERTSLLQTNDEMSKRLEAMGAQLSTLEGRFNSMEQGGLDQPGTTHTAGGPDGVLP